MTLLEDPLNLKLLEFLCSGTGTSVNISELSRQFKKHRNTIKSKIKDLYDYKIIEKPLCPLIWLFNEYPLLVIEKDCFPRDEKTVEWIEKDPHIWTAFFIKEEEYNTLMIELHKNLYSYQNWRESIIDSGKVATCSCSYPSETIFLSTENIIKYDHSSSVHIIEEDYLEKRYTKINGLMMDKLSINVLKTLLSGKGIRTNETVLAKKTKIHRKTVQRKIDKFLKERIILPPVCRFPRIWFPPGYFSVLSLVEIKDNKEEVLESLKGDPHVPFMIKAYTGKYNLVIFGIFYKIEEHLKWQEEYGQKFVDSIGAIKNTYLSPAMAFSIAQEYVAMTFLESKQRKVRAKSLMKLMRSS